MSIVKKRKESEKAKEEATAAMKKNDSSGQKTQKTGLKMIGVVSSFQTKVIFCSGIQSKIRSLFTQQEAA